MCATPATVELDVHRANYEAVASERETQPAFVRALRERAMERFAELGFPSRREEAWRFTSVTRIAETAWELAPAQAELGDRSLVARWEIPDSDALVFVDGRFSARLSSVGDLPAGVTAGSLARALDARSDTVERHLGKLADLEHHPFAALATAFLADGVFIHVPRGVVLERPLHLVFVTTGGAAPRVSFPRNLLVFEPGSQASLVETWIGTGEGEALTVPVTEIVVEDGAVVDHVRRQREPFGVTHMDGFWLRQGRSSTFSSHTFTLGGELVRNDVNASLEGEGSDCVLNGLYVIGGQQHVDTHMTVEHRAPHCSSHELFKGVLEDRARAVFNGLIHVHRDAQKTDAKQSNRNLILSDKALVNSNPQLLIYADDVKCTHGSTVGQLDDDAVFYLRSRGLSQEAAQSLLTYAFAADVIGRVKLDPVREELEATMFSRLPQGEVVRQAV